MPYNRPIRQQYAVIGDGPVESLYFESIKNEFRDSLSNCTLRPEIPKHTNVEELERLIQKCISLDYDMIICIIDMDTKLGDTQEMCRYEKLKKTCKKNNSCVHFIETHPCTELWFYYYFCNTTRPLYNYDPHVKELIRKKIPGYDKKAPFCTHSHMCKCGGDLNSAIQYGRLSMDSKASDSRDYTYSNMADFFEIIGIVPPRVSKKRLNKK